MGGLASKQRISKQEKLGYIKNSPFYLYLIDETLEEFGKCFPFVKHCKEGDEISLDENTIYIIGKGSLELSATMADPSMKIENKGYLCKKHPGDLVSLPKEQDMATEQLSPQTKKLSTFVEQVRTKASSDSVILYNDAKALEAFLDKYPELSCPFSAIISSHIETYLSNIPFLANVKQSKLAVLAAMCKYESLEADEVVFEENTPGDKLYIILSGSAKVLAPQQPWISIQQSLEWGNEIDRNNENVTVAGLKNGDYFGETSLFVNVNRTSTVKTSGKSLFVTVERKTFENFCAVCPQIKQDMQMVMKERMVSNLSSLSIPFLIGIPPSSLKMLTNDVQVKETTPGEVIFRQNDVGDRFYIIVFGNVKIEKEEVDESGNVDPKITNLGSLGAGNYFGEMALVDDEPTLRTATVTSEDNAILLTVDKDSFRKIFGKNDNSLTEFTLRLLRSESELKHFLNHSLGLSTFTSYMKKTMAEENIKFWKAATEFRRDFSSHEGNKMKANAQEIIETFCTEASPSPINIPCSMRNSLVRKDVEPNPDIFNDAIDEIYRLMVRDNFARFKRTPEFQEFFNCLGSL